MSDLISRKQAIRALQGLDMLKEIRIWDGWNPFDFVMRMFLEAESVIGALPSAEPERTGMMTTHEVACLLADIFDDPCACNYNGIDEWLPSKCELQDACWHPVGVACWEQFLKWRGDR